jgi:hypothetical protein
VGDKRNRDVRKQDLHESRTATRPHRATSGAAVQIGQSLGPKLRKALEGPSCLRCSKPVDLRRQPTGNGWLHQSCEGQLTADEFLARVEQQMAGVPEESQATL